MKEPHVGKLSREQYEQGKPSRLYAADLQERQWYLARGTGESARTLGAYALEALMELVALKPLDDLHEVHVRLLDQDGQVVGEGETILHHDGMLRAPDEPDEEGYFLAYPGTIDGQMEAADRSELVLEATR